MVKQYRILSHHQAIYFGLSAIPDHHLVLANYL